MRIGTTAFGGPAAHIALMEEELVRRLQWLTPEEFLDLVGAANLIPGPNSTEITIHVGYKLRGWQGLITAGAAFIMPAFLIVWAIAWFYVKFGTLPAMQSVFTRIQPVILAVMAQAIWNLSKSAIKDRILAFFAAISLLLYFYAQNEILVLFVVAGLNLVVRQKPSAWRKGAFFGAVPLLLCLPWQKAVAQVELTTKVPVEGLFFFFAKVGSVLFGSGYVLIAFLQSDLVERYHWITQQQLFDAITVGQFTPGPVFTTATFIGYLVSGHAGAIAATVGIFLPAFFFVALSAPFVSRLRRSHLTAPLLDGLNVASLGLMGGAGVLLAKGSIFSPYGAIAFLTSLVLLTRFKINSAWIILCAGLLGASEIR